MRAAIVFNPMAGRWRAAQVVAWAADALRARGATVDVRTTQRPGQAGQLAARARDEGMDAVLAAGGDGTVGAVAEALAGSPSVLGVLPIGTANLWAHELGLGAGLATAEDVRECLDRQLAGTVRPVDVGRCGDRVFLLWAGVGLDAHVISGVEPRPEFVKRLGIAYYYAAGLLAGMSYRGGPMTIRTETGTLAGVKLLAVVTNVRLYAGSVLDPDARVDDGLLDVWAMDGRSYFDALRQLYRFKLGQHIDHPTVHKLRGRQVDIELGRPMRFQLDGEAPRSVTAIEFQVWPGGLQVFAPRRPLPIFQEASREQTPN